MSGYESALRQRSDDQVIGITSEVSRQLAICHAELARRGVKMPRREPLPENVIDFRRASKWAMPRSITTGAS